MESTESRDFRLQSLGRSVLGLDFNNSVPLEKVFRKFAPQRFPAPPVIGLLANNVVGFRDQQRRTRLFPPYAYPEYSMDAHASLEEKRKLGMRRDGDDALTPMDPRKKAAVELTNQLNKASQRSDFREVLRLISGRASSVEVYVLALVRLSEMAKAQVSLKVEIQSSAEFEDLLGKIGKLWTSRDLAFTSALVMAMFECLVFWDRISASLTGEFFTYLAPFLDQLSIQEHVLKLLTLVRLELVNHAGIFAINDGIRGFIVKVVEVVCRREPEPHELGVLALTLAVAQMRIEHFTNRLVVHVTRNPENFTAMELLYSLFYLLVVGHTEDADLVASVSRVLRRVSTLGSSDEDAAIACYVLPQYTPNFDKQLLLPYFERLCFSQAWRKLSPFMLSRALYGLSLNVETNFIDSSVLCPLEVHIQDLAKRHNRTCDADAIARFLAVFTMKMEARSFIVDALSVRFLKDTSQSGLAMADCLQACVASGNSVLSPNEVDAIMTTGVPKLPSPRAAMNLIVSASGFAAVEKLRQLVDKFLSFPEVNLKELVLVMQSLIERSFFHSGVSQRLSTLLTGSSLVGVTLSPLFLQAVQALNEVDRSGHLDDGVVEAVASHLASYNNVNSISHSLYVDLLVFVALRYPKLGAFKAVASKLCSSKLPYLSADYRWRMFLALAIFATDDAACADCLKYIEPSLSPYTYAPIDVHRLVALLDTAEAQTVLVFDESFALKPELVVNGRRALVVQDRPYLSLMNSDERKQSVTQRLHVRYLDFVHGLDCVVVSKVDVNVFADRTVQKLIHGEPM